MCRQVANSWRTTAGLTDSLQATWEGILRVLDNSAGLARFAAPGGWNNLDLLAVSHPPTNPSNVLSQYVCMLDVGWE
jgi:hypothetical protein